MPNRIVRDAILTSDAVCSLGWPEEVFYRRLMSIVDDYGRHEAGVQLLRSRCYPLQTDLVRVADISRWMAACQKAGLILVYEVAGKQYLQIQKFGQQQRSASKCPSPIATDINCKQVPADAHLDVSVVVVEDVVDSSVPNGTGGKPPVAEPEKTEDPPANPHADPPADPRRELYLAGKSLLEEQGMPKNQTGSFITKLAKDYGQDFALEAVRSAVTNRPLEAAAYLKATCQRLKGERKDPITVVTETADEYTARVAKEREAERARGIVPPPPKIVAMLRGQAKEAA